VIIDFGLGTFVDDESYIYYRCGTAGFVSPEVMSSSKTQKIGPESDVFSVGSVFHYLLTSKPLFEGKTT
jgi:calcium-dependent protein kinase